MIWSFLFCFHVLLGESAWLDLSIPGYPKSNDLTCSTCDIVAKAIEKQLLSVDEKQTILLGGRLEGGEAHKKIKYARSEAHLIDILEKLCDNLPAHSAVAQKNKQWKFITQAQKQDWDDEKKAKEAADKNETEGEAAAAPKPTGFERVLGVGDEHKKLKSCCERFLGSGDVEDSLIEYLHKNWNPNLDLRNKLCVEITKSCPTRTRKVGAKEPKEKSDL